MKKKHIYTIALCSVLAMLLLFAGQFVLIKNNYEATKESYRRQLFTAFGIALNKVFINRFDSLNTALLQLSNKVSIDSGITRSDIRLKNYYTSEWGPKIGFPYYANSDAGSGWLKEGIPVIYQELSNTRKEQVKKDFISRIAAFANSERPSLQDLFDSLLQQHNITVPVQYHLSIRHLVFHKDQKEYLLLSNEEALIPISSTWKDKSLSPVTSSGIWKVAGVNYEMYCSETFYWPDETLFIIKRNVYLIILSAVIVLIFIILNVWIIRYLLKQKKLEDIKNDFINNIKHEMKTPIASLQIASTSLQMKEVVDKPQEVAYLSAIVNRQAKRLQFIWDEIAYLSEEKGIPLIKENINLREQLLSSVESSKLLYPNIKVHFHIEQDKEYFIYANKEEMNTVWINIIDNAFKYSVNDILILKVSIQGNHDEIVILFTDNGRGVAKTDLPYIFDQFYRGEHENIHNTKGLGIGLYNSKNILKKYGARIELKNNVSAGISVFITFKKDKNEYSDN